MIGGPNRQPLIDQALKVVKKRIDDEDSRVDSGSDGEQLKHRDLA